MSGKRKWRVRFTKVDDSIEKIFICEVYRKIRVPKARVRRAPNENV